MEVSGDTKWEQTCPGALYVALSRAKHMGTFTSETDYPLDSAIYWIGSGICNFRILEGHMKKSKKKGGTKEKCVLITKRDKWVEYLHRKQSRTNTTFLIQPIKPTYGISKKLTGRNKRAD